MSTWPDPEKPGVPLHPERDGWHWLSWQGGEPRAWEWDAETCPFGDRRAPGGWRYHDAQRYGASGISTPRNLASTGWAYLGPCLTPAETDALRAKNARMRAALEDLLDDFEVHDFGEWFEDRLKQARAALEVKP